ncbi:hypothetical protein D9M71_506490 [compost metagenome]
MFAQHVAGGAGDIGDDGCLAPGQGIEQAGFARVRPAGDHHGHAVAQQRALSGFAQHAGEFIAYLVELAEDVAIGEEVDLLLGEIDGRLDVDAQLDELLRQPMDAPGELALQRAHGVARGLGGTGLDQVGDGLGLGQVELVVEEGAFAEFAGARLAGAELQAALQEHVHHHRAAVALQLQHVLAGEGVRAGEVQQQSLVDHLAVVGVEGAVMRMSRCRLAATQGDADDAGARAGDADDADAATTLGGGDGGDGFTGCVHGGFLGKSYAQQNAPRGGVLHSAGWAIRPKPSSPPLRSAG